MKNKLFIFIHIIFVLLCIIGDILVGLYFKFNISFYYSSLFFTMGIGIGNLLIMIIHLLIDTKFKFGKFIPILHASYVFITFVFYNIIEWVKRYNEFYLMYWILLYSLILVDIIIFIIINKKLGNKKAVIGG